MTSAPSVHIHEVLFWLQRGNAPLARSEFSSKLAAEFGPETCFRSCSQDGLQGEGALEFLLARGKVVESDGQIDLHPNMKICDGHLKPAQQPQ